MPPNVKEVAVALADLDLSEHVLSKYAPLTSEPIAPPAAAQQQQQHEVDEAEQTAEVAAKPSAIEHHEQEEQQQQEVIRSNVDSDSYWDMPPDEPEPEPTPEEKRQEVIDQILHEEKLRQMFSVDHIVANLTRDAATEEEAEKVEQVKEEVKVSEAEAESYWDMPAEESENTNEQADSAIETADLEDCFSVNHIVTNLIAEGQRLTEQEQQQHDDDDDNLIIAPHVNDPTHPNHAYWDHWDTSPQATSYEAKRRKLVQQIMEEEAARQMLSCEHILNNMRSVDTATEAGLPTAPTDKDDGNGGEEEAYWSFHHPSDPADTIVASHVTHPSAHPDTIDYWTWDTSPKSTEEQRKVIVDWIMREERARVATSTEVLVDNLISYAADKERCLSDNNNDDDNVEESKESAEGYWDW